MHPTYHSLRTPDKVVFAASDGSQTITYARLEAESNQTAHLLRDLGLNQGDGIAILLDNDPRFLIVAWAAQRSGLYYTPISTFFQAAEVGYILSNADAKVLFTKRALFERLTLESSAHLTVILLDDDEPETWSEQIKAYSPLPIADECEGAEMIYSSGTTGQPKGVRFEITGQPLGTVSPLIQKRIDLHQVDATCRYLSTAPLYHSAPLRYNLLVSRLGGTSIIMKKFDAEAALRLIQDERITHSQWVPTMFVRLLALAPEVRGEFDLSSHRIAIHAAAPCPKSVKHAMIEWWGDIIHEYYSGTESNGSTAISPSEWLAHPGSVGKAFHGEIKILDEQFNELPAGTTGQIYFAGGNTFSYHKDPAKTASAYSPQGWSSLGDIGYVDDEGYLYLKDRKSFMIISGGVNIYPQEIEDVLINHPAVLDVAVFGIPDSEFGEAVKAVVELVPSETPSKTLEATLITYCREHLSPIKSPKSVDFSDALPRHPTGKLYKSALKAQYWPSDQSIAQ
ncbi:MAG: acyl-CoA synthetase [Pseudomonadota bacterium]|nr:acyl-CoA synthetase [Pseudomonadota bacterium]